MENEDEQKSILLRSIFDLMEDLIKDSQIDPLQQYVASKHGNTTVYHIPNNVFMNFDISEIKKHYSHFDWQLDSRCNYCTVTTVLRESKLLNK